MKREFTTDQTAICDRIKKLKAVTNIAAYFEPAFGSWQKQYGPKPTRLEMGLVKLLYPAKHTGPEFAAGCMFMREGGASDAEYTAPFQCLKAHNANITGSTSLVARGGVTRWQAPAGDGSKASRWGFVITPRGWQTIEANLVAAENEQNAQKAVKGAGKPKGKGKPVVATTPVVDAENASAVTAEAPEGNVAHTVADIHGESLNDACERLNG